MAAAAFFEIAGEDLVPTELTRGPWDPDAQHAGPPAALLGRAVEDLAARAAAPMRVGRITYEILRPVPIAPLRITTSIERDGRRVKLVLARLLADGVEVVRAAAWLIRTEDLELPPDLQPGPPSHRPADGAAAKPYQEGAGYAAAVEARFVAGGFLERGPATVWMRSRVPLMAGEEPTPLQRLLIVADSGNGVSSELDWNRFLFVNVELTVHLYREPAGEWVCLDAVTRLAPDGIGLTETALADERGPLGRAAQALLVARR